MISIFKRWPLLNTMTAYGVLWTFSDIVQELVVSRKEHLNWGKAARIGATGAFINAPLVHGWIHLLQTYLPGTSTKTVIRKVILDQLVFAPIAVSAFYLGTSAFKGENGIRELRVKFMTTYWIGFFYWPVVQMMNFRHVPHQHKPLAVASASFVWTIFLCYMKERKFNGGPHVRMPFEV